ncbi:MAG: zf-HC2 domain-containing protein [Actinomycetota bacterium]|nr:zf-HC2 domain-containing protein [Actinomycetota bacterium]
MTIDPCVRCEELLQPFLDRALTEDERRQAEEHLELCQYCRTRYRFEASLRRYVRQASSEEMPPELKARLAALRIPL